MVGSMARLMATSKRVYTKGDLPRLLLPVFPSLWWAPANPRLQGVPPTLAGSFGSVSCGVTAPFLWVLVWQGFVCGLQDWSLCFLQSCGSLVIKSHWPSRSDTLGIRSLSDAQAGKPEVGLRTFPTVSELLWYYFSSVCGLPTWQAWDLIVIVPLLQSCCGFLSLDVGILFLVGSSILLSMVVHQLVVTLVFRWVHVLFCHLDSSPFLNLACNLEVLSSCPVGSVVWGILSVTLLSCEMSNCAVVWTLFGIPLLWDWNKNWPFHYQWL